MSVKRNYNKYKTYNVTAGLHVSTLTESSSDPHDTTLTESVVNPTMRNNFFVWTCIMNA
jgi:hypothetical protein